MVYVCLFLHVILSHQKSQNHEIVSLDVIWASLTHDKARFCKFSFLRGRQGIWSSVKKSAGYRPSQRKTKIPAISTHRTMTFDKVNILIHKNIIFHRVLKKQHRASSDSIGQYQAASDSSGQQRAAVHVVRGWDIECIVPVNVRDYIVLQVISWSLVVSLIVLSKRMYSH